MKGIIWCETQEHRDFCFLYKIVGNNGGKLDVFLYLCAPKRAGGGLLREGNERHGACNSLVFRIIIN